ncbi:MAG: hypothetical protein ABIE42_05590 [Candidatus Eisenbacteria bacterium]
MRGKTVLIVLVAVLATAASTFLATRAITGTVTEGRVSSASADAGPGEIQSKGTEVAKLVDDIDESSAADAVTSDDRDPMVTYKAEPKPQPATAPAAPSAPTWPSYKVTAVLLGDDDPRAFLRLGSESISVKIGTEISGGRVTAIEPDGVTIEGKIGTKKFPF